MARIPEIERRLLNWARYLARLNSGGGNYATVQLDQERVDRTGYDAASPIPIGDAEAEATDKAVERLELGQRDAVRAAYLGTGSVAEKARRIGVSLATLYARVDLAHKVLEREFAAAKAAADAERRRVEQLQRWRPPGSTGSVAAPPAPQHHGSSLAEHLDRIRAERGGFTK